MGVSLLAFTSTILRTCGRILYSYLFPVAIGLMLMVSPAHAQFTITENFKSSSAGNVTLGGSAKLTSGTIDPVGDGWLRLTEDKNNDVGYAFVNQGFPSTLGVLMDFEYVSWRRSNAPGFPMGADGFSIFLFDDNVTATTFRLGAAGGSLGYAQSTSSGNTGLNGGYVGIGIDEFGNYSTCSDGKSGGEPNCNFGHPDLISARGPAPNYAYIQGSSVGTSLDYDVLTNTRPTAAQFYRRVQIQITKTGPAGSYQILVKSTTTPGGTLTTLFGPVTLSSPPPARLKLGFAASTGGAWNKHEVRNLIITTPGNIRVQKLVDKSTVKVGDQLTYRITTYNETAAAITGLPLKDTFPAGFSPTSITFSNDGFAGNTASGYTNTDLSNARLNMAANSNSTFIVTGTVTSKPIGGTLTNTARVDPAAAGITDGDPTNDVSSASTQVISPDFTVTKTHTGNLRKSLSGSFTITVRNSGTDPQPLNSAVNLTDVIPAGFTVTGAPTGTGWSFTGTSGNSIVASRSDQLAAGSSYPLITIPVRVDVNAANSLTNMAVVKNAYDANAANDTSRDVVDTRRNMDLQVVSYVLPSQKKGCVGTPYNVQVNIRNNGPDSALNGRFNFKVPTASNVITLVSRTITSGAGSFSGGSTDPVNGYTDFVTLTSGAAATYIFSVLVTNPAPADLAICEATLLRSSTDLDIDASDPTIAIPTDPQHECDALPSGPTCNNILRDTVFVSSTVTANAGPDQQLCNTTTGQLAATAPPSGTGAWSQYTGPNTAGITNPALNNTTITNLAPGTYG
ncbi:MAG TPA: hypothetical protein VM802_15440, partial [Chitinophaga sp.]|uniref:hypothetical protein n=1 Tax=Chitinophaga sp. TaxID=1869181 RepID=UPI002B97223B